MSFVKNALEEASSTLSKFLTNSKNLTQIEDAISLLVKCSYSKNHIFSCGNGGSLCDSMHFAEELTGRFRQDRPSVAAMSISDPSHLTCVANDYGYDQVFERFLQGWGKKDDVLLALSTSGNSENVHLAAHEAKKKGMKIIGLLGKDGGKLKDLADIPIIVPSHSTDRIQEIHIKIIHIFIEGMERSLFPKNYL
jgi:D-sedoheptulose 7-phosphate isomerase